MLGPLHLPEVAAVAGLLALCVGRLTGGQPLIRMTREVVGVLGLGVVMLATAPFSVWPGGVFKTFLDVYLKVALIFILLTHSVGSLQLLRRVTWIMVLAMAYVALRGIFDYGRGVNVEDGRLVGIVSRADLVRLYTRRDEDIAEEIREDVVRRMLWIDPARLTVGVDNGEVVLDGDVDTQSEEDMLLKLVALVPGVVGVRSRLSWAVDRDGRPTANARA